MKKFKSCFVLLLFCMSMFAQPSNITQTKGSQFIQGNQPYHFLGTNFWYGLHLANPENPADWERLQQELDQLKELGIKNLRIMVGFEGPSDAPWRAQPSIQNQMGEIDESMLKWLDYLLDELAKREMTAVLCLTNYYYWSGGMAQYVSWVEKTPIPYPNEGKTWTKYLNYAARFFVLEQAKEVYYDFVKQIVGRTNSVNGLPYKDDPSIFSWQLANEPRGMFHAKAYTDWVKYTAQLIKSLDPNHMISLGGEGLTPSFIMGTAFKTVSAFQEIDYLTVHIWVQNWGWFNPEKDKKAYRKARKKALSYLQKHIKIAKELNKPLVLEEFGIARDLGNYAPEASTAIRDQYYEDIFERVYQSSKHKKSLVGVNFWAWGGAGRPIQPGGDWKIGGPWTGDPPHEPQGWYSVYDKDTSTLEIIKKYASLLNGI